MDFNQHLDLAGKHAFLSASSYHWLNYTPEKLAQVYENNKAKEKGTMLHAWASIAITEGIKLARLKKALNMFVNDAIGFRMASEVVLYFSDNCFGTADAIVYKDDVLRIHDLKTGISKPSFSQLSIYGALFCLEYEVNPFETVFLQRIYQGNGFEERIAEPDEISEIMHKIVEFDRVLDDVKLTLG